MGMVNKLNCSNSGKIVLLALCIAGMIFALFLGCEKAKEKEAKDKSTLEKVALNYWDNRLVTRNYQASYERELDPDSLPFEKYKELVSRNEKLQFSGLRVETEKMEKEDEARIAVTLEAKTPGMPAAFDRTFKDVWIYTSGAWKHRFSKNQP